jgi:aryl-alcohol dehydrogenase-like predicted oxidoreductase
MPSAIGSPKNPRLVLGTVQLGLAYGAANRTGVPSEADAIAMVRTALGAGVRSFDTARVYGESESRIGRALSDPSSPTVTVVTKLDPMPHLGPDASPALARRTARESLAASRRALQRDRIDVLLLHRPVHRTLWGGTVWHLLQEERAASRIGRLGVSVGSPEEARLAIADQAVEHLLLPFNLLDYRWDDAGVVQDLRQRPLLTVHVRSVLLQGLLAGGGANWPDLPGVEPSAVLGQLSELGNNLRRSDTVDLCLAFVRAQDWIDGIVIGVETKAQLAGLLGSFARPRLLHHQVEFVRNAVPHYPERLLDPSSWSQPGSRTRD